MADTTAVGMPNDVLAMFRRDAENLSFEIRDPFLDYLDQRPNDVDHPADPRTMFTKLRRLSDHACESEVKKAVGKAILENKTPVNVFFDCLPSPEEFERELNGNDEGTALAFWLACSYAVRSFKALTAAHGRTEMTEAFRDPVLDKLFLYMDRAARDQHTEDDEVLSDFMVSELMFIGSSSRRIICSGCSAEYTIYDNTLGTTEAFVYATKEDMEKLNINCQNKTCPFYTEEVSATTIPHRNSPYNERTRRLLGYLSWLSHGRRDAECTFTKPWDNKGRRPRPEELGATPGPGPGPDLRSLPVGLVHTEDLVSCPETRGLYRRACMFSVVFNHYVLATFGILGTMRAVALRDGISVATMDGPEREREHDLPRCEYAGIAPGLDLGRPEVQGALQAYCCREMCLSARALFEYFFLDSGADIKFMDFVPKNANTPVMQIIDGWPRSNMRPSHTVAVLTTTRSSSGRRQFVLDPSAAQYGWADVFAPLDTYARCRVDFRSSVYSCVPLDPRRPPTRDTPRPPGDDNAAGRWRRRCAAEYILGQVRNYIPGGDLGRLIDGSQGGFERHCSNLDRQLGIFLGAYSRGNCF